MSLICSSCWEAFIGPFSSIVMAAELSEIIGLSCFAAVALKKGNRRCWQLIGTAASAIFVVVIAATGYVLLCGAGVAALAALAWVWYLTYSVCECWDRRQQPSQQRSAVQLTARDDTQQETEARLTHTTSSGSLPSQQSLSVSNFHNNLSRYPRTVSVLGFAVSCSAAGMLVWKRTLPAVEGFDSSTVPIWIYFTAVFASGIVVLSVVFVRLTRA